jgi:aspartate--ammonia ligase
MFPVLTNTLSDKVSFITSQELEDMYPDKSPKERENLYVKEHKTAFIMQIGKKLRSGQVHDKRAPDYDDWDLNGDILVWDALLGRALELSSMGIRVDEEAMDRQLRLAGKDERRELPFHKAILNGELPYSIGGGIGQSRLCMYFLKRAHIGEVQVGLWPDEMVRECGANNIFLL